MRLNFVKHDGVHWALAGVDASRKLLIAVGDLDIYDATTVQAFLQAPAFEQMIGGILYEGIFEFLQRVDIIGNIVCVCI